MASSSTGIKSTWFSINIASFLLKSLTSSAFRPTCLSTRHVLSAPSDGVLAQNVFAPCLLIAVLLAGLGI